MQQSLRLLSGLSLAILCTACVTERVVYREPPRPYVPPPAYQPPPPPPQSVVSVYIEPPIGQPEAIGCPWAPPPMLVEAPPPPPFEGAIWTGGYWVWHDTWVWAHGRWAAPPRPYYRWHQPYYENRDGMVIFITGHWGAPDVVFVPPPPGIRISIEIGGRGIIPGPRPLGPPGVFVPPPPGSRAGLIIPAPMGTAPSVVTSAPPVVNVGMRITNNVNNGNISNTTNINNSRTTVINNVTNVTIMAPPSATASGQAVNASVPAQAHLAAAMPSVVHAAAPMPASTRPMPAFAHGQAHVDLPPPQIVHPAATPVPPPHPAPPTPAQPRPSAPPPPPPAVTAPHALSPEAHPQPSPAAPAPSPLTPRTAAPAGSPATPVVQDHPAPPPPRGDRFQESENPRQGRPQPPVDGQGSKDASRPKPADKPAGKQVDKAKKDRPKPADAKRPKPKDEGDVKKVRDRERD